MKSNFLNLEIKLNLTFESWESKFVCFRILRPLLLLNLLLDVLLIQLVARATREIHGISLDADGVDLDCRQVSVF